MYTVKEAARKLGVSPHTVRYYDAQSLVPGVVRDESGGRLFDEAAMERLFVVVALRKTGMPVSEVRRYEELYARGGRTVRERLRIMEGQRERLLAQMEELQVSLELLDRKVAHYEHLAAGEPDDWDHAYMQSLMERSRKVEEDG